MSRDAAPRRHEEARLPTLEINEAVLATGAEGRAAGLKFQIMVQDDDQPPRPMEVALVLTPIAERLNDLMGRLEAAFEIQSDSLLLRLTRTNLLENAVEYSPPGGPVLITGERPLCRAGDQPG